MKKYLPKSVVLEKGEKVSFVSARGGLGLGYLVDGYIYESCGNGFYVVVDVKVFTRDGGKMYVDKIKSLGLFPGYNIV